jgi:hypothetical protein
LRRRLAGCATSNRHGIHLQAAELASAVVFNTKLVRTILDR